MIYCRYSLDFLFLIRCTAHLENNDTADMQYKRALEGLPYQQPSYGYFTVDRQYHDESGTIEVKMEGSDVTSDGSHHVTSCHVVY